MTTGNGALKNTGHGPRKTRATGHGRTLIYTDWGITQTWMNKQRHSIDTI